MKRTELHRFLVAIGVAAFWFGLWQLGAFFAERNGWSIFLPTPVAVAKRLGQLLGTRAFWEAVCGSLLRVLLGFAIGCLLGVTLAACAARIPPLRALLSPALTVLKATPVASFIMLAWVFIGRSTLPSFVATVMVLPLVWESTLGGIRSLDPQLKEVAALYRIRLPQRLCIWYLPALRPHLSAAAVTAMGLAWKAGVATEILVHTVASLGQSIYDAKTTLEMEDLFAFTITVIALSLVLEATLRTLFRLSERRVEA